MESIEGMEFLFPLAGDRLQGEIQYASESPIKAAGLCYSLPVSACADFMWNVCGVDDHRVVAAGL